MKKAILRLLFKKYKPVFEEMLVESMYGDVPKDVAQPALDFLANGREKLDKFFHIHAYNLQRKALTDVKNIQYYHGNLVNIKVMLTAIAQAKLPQRENVKKQEAKKDPIDEVKSFIEAGKNRLKKK